MNTPITPDSSRFKADFSPTLGIPPQAPQVADSVAAAKQKLRTQVRMARAALTPEVAARKDAAIIAALRAVLAERGATRVAAYAPMVGEPGGAALVPALADVVSELWLPVCRPGRVLRWGRYEGPESLFEGSFGILEPHDTSCDNSVLDELDVVVVPAVAVDSQGFRLGQGAGFYDRTLANCKAFTVVTVYKEEVVPVPREPHDVALAKIVTDA